MKQMDKSQENSLQSCDTFAVCKAYSETEENLFAKNSDRPVGEVQRLCFAKGGEHKWGEMIRCTQMEIPQAEHTYTVWGSQPFWIWGFEMGFNEKGLVIGNEAEGSRCPTEPEEGLLGMDILRLALERSATAREAITVITDLISQYGQNANACLWYEHRYENSFILMDEKEIWVLETAGRRWIAKQLKDWWAISNCYSLEDDFDCASADLEAYARKNCWIGEGEAMNFAKAYSAAMDRQPKSLPRWRRMKKLLKQAIQESPAGKAGVSHAKAILRDHFEGEIIEPRYGRFYGAFMSICMHALTNHDAQTSASLISTYDPLLGLISRYAQSVPCCSVYIPVYQNTEIPEAMQIGEGTYDAKSLWWNLERLNLAVSLDEARFDAKVSTSLRALEAEIESQATDAENKARECIKQGNEKEGWKLLETVTADACRRVMTLAKDLADEISADVVSQGGIYGIKKEFVELYLKRTGIPLFE